MRFLFILLGSLILLAPQTQAQTQLSPTGAAPLPLPASVINQAKEQREGHYSPMSRPATRMPGGQIQTVWDDATTDAGSHRFDHCEDCVYKVRTREFMITTIVLPPEATITEADVGDPSGFKVKIHDSNIIAIKPTAIGRDTSLNVYTEKGEVYAFYVRAEGVNSGNIPDVVVRINKPNTIDVIKSSHYEKSSQEHSLPAVPTLPTLPPEILANLQPSYQKEQRNRHADDFIEAIEFDPAELHGWEDYKLWGSAELRPNIVFRDKQFTYIQFGDKWDGLELPTAYVVIDDIDELVNTRVQGKTYIIENTARLITLKSGSMFMCIEFTGERT